MTVFEFFENEHFSTRIDLMNILKNVLKIDEKDEDNNDYNSLNRYNK